MIQLSPRSEPEIYAATRRFGTVLENVVFDEVTRHVDLDDDSLHREHARLAIRSTSSRTPCRRGRPATRSNVVLLTCDAQGVLPPIARLTPDQALYHFVSGYTSKVAGTEAGLGNEPEITFSTCFGAPFMVHHPAVYADLLKRKIERHGARCWLVNTGWTGGPFGVGKRISIEHTRALLDAALSGALDGVDYRVDPVFGFEVPEHCPGLPDDVLRPRVDVAERGRVLGALPRARHALHRQLPQVRPRVPAGPRRGRACRGERSTQRRPSHLSAARP